MTQCEKNELSITMDETPELTYTSQVPHVGTANLRNLTKKMIAEDIHLQLYVVLTRSL